MSEEILVRQGAPTLAGIKTGSLFPCPCEDKEALFADIRRLNRLLVPKGLCLLPIRFLKGQVLLYLYRPSELRRDLEDEQAAEAERAVRQIDAVIVAVIEFVEEFFCRRVILLAGLPLRFFDRGHAAVVVPAQRSNHLRCA